MKTTIDLFREELEEFFAICEKNKMLVAYRETVPYGWTFNFDFTKIADVLGLLLKYHNKESIYRIELKIAEYRQGVTLIITFSKEYIQDNIDVKYNMLPIIDELKKLRTFTYYTSKYINIDDFKTRKEFFNIIRDPVMDFNGDYREFWNQLEIQDIDKNVAIYTNDFHKYMRREFGVY